MQLLLYAKHLQKAAEENQKCRSLQVFTWLCTERSFLVSFSTLLIYSLLYLTITPHIPPPLGLFFPLALTMISLLFFLFVLLHVCLPLVECKLQEAGDLRLCCSLLQPQGFGCGGWAGTTCPMNDRGSIYP